MMGRGKSEIPALANIFSCNFSPETFGLFFGMMEWFRILFRVLCSSSLCVVYMFFRGFAYVCCCLRFCFLPFALGLCARVRERVCVCVLTGLLFSMLHAPPSNTTFLLACVNVWCLCLRGANDEGAGKE